MEAGNNNDLLPCKMRVGRVPKLPESEARGAAPHGRMRAGKGRLVGAFSFLAFVELIGEWGGRL